MLKQRINQDLKTAMLAGDKVLVTMLRGLKSAILYVEVAKGVRDSGGLSDAEIQEILSKESKKRQESADLYALGKDEARTTAELSEKAIIDAYLPKQMSTEDLQKVVDEVLSTENITEKKDMGRAITLIKAKTAGTADGSLIAQLVKAKLK